MDAPIEAREIEDWGTSPGVGSTLLVNELAATASAMAPPLLTAALEVDRVEGTAGGGWTESVGEEGPERIACAKS